MMMKKYLFVLLCVFNSAYSYSQVLTQHFSKGEAKKEGVKIKRQLPSQNIIEMPPVDVNRLLKEDEEMAGEDVPYRFGYGFDVAYSLDDGEWEDNEDGRLWSMTIKSKGAFSLNFVFEDFSLPDGAYLNIVNSDESVVYGPVTSSSIPDDKFFLTDIIPDSLVTIYIFEPYSQKGKSKIQIKRIVHGYQEYLINDNNGCAGSSASCNIPVENYFPNYEKEAGAVALILLENGSALCSGSLVMTTDMLFKPYVLTAFHCVNTEKPEDYIASSSEKSKVNHWLIKFGYRAQSSYAITFNGANYRAGWYDSDFALVELFENAKQIASLTWLGWNRTGNTPTKGIGIHHPCGDYMKISLDNDVLQSTTWPLTTSHWTTHWEYGITQGGSSGSPLLDQNKRIVGQVHGKIYENGQGSTTPPCSMKYTSYGKFDISWTGGGTSTTRLSNWLDPIGTGQNTIDTKTYVNIIGDNTIRTSNVYYVENLSNAYTVTWSLSDNYYNQNCLQQNTPSANQCTISNSSNQGMSNATLTATIKYGGVVVRTLKKSQISATGITGTYYNGVSTKQLNYPSPLLMRPYSNVSISSNRLKGATVSFSGSPSSVSWSHNSSNGLLLFNTPSTYSTFVIHMDCSNGESYNLSIVVTSSANQMNVLNKDGQVEVSLVPIEVEDMIGFNSTDNLIKSEPINWTLEVYNSTTGEKVFCEKVDGSNYAIDTTGWKPGVYIVRAIIGDEVLNEKIIVK